MIRRLFRVAISSLGSSQKLQFRPFHLRRRYSPFLDFEEDRKFRLLLDVEDFHPGDIDVKVQDGKIKISAHKTSAYSNWRDSSQITREYDIPKDVDASTIKSHIDSGLLSIEGDRRVTGEAKRIDDEKEYIMKIDLNGFTAKDVTIKQDGNEITIEAKQEIKNVEGDQFQSKCARKFLRKFLLPHNVDHEVVNAKFTTDGRLVLSSPYVKGAKSETRNITIKEE